MEASKLVSCGPSLPRRATFLGGENGEMKRGTPRHPKTYALAEFLGVPLYSAVGILEMLWHHANQHTPRGDIGSLPDAAISEASGWNKKPSILIEALVKSRWIEIDNDYRFIIHDWPDHCEQSAIKWLEYNHTDFLPIYGVSLENRKRKSRDSLPSRVAMAMAGVSEDLKEKKDGEILPPELDEQFLEYQRLFRLVGNPIPEDFAAGSFCWRAWSILDFEQREAVVESLKVREAAGVQVLHSADNYISKREYKRPLRKATNGNGKPDILAEMLAEERAKRA